MEDELEENQSLPNQLLKFINLDIVFDYIGVLPTDYANINDFSKMQDGYRFNSVTGECFVSDEVGEWQDGWYVFAQNMMGDPFYIDFTQEDIGFPVYFSYHGAGKWESLKIADTLGQFENILRIIKGMDVDTPFELSSLSLEIDSSNAFWLEVRETCKELGCD